MQINHIPFNKIPQLSTRDIAYAMKDEALRPFYKYDVNIESFAQIISDKQKDNTDRTLLVKELKAQYEQLAINPLVAKQIESLSQPTTFTIITAHQPSLFTGPLYFVIKILSTINLTKQLNKAYTQHHFVPIFLTGGEDHDFEEANHLHLFGKTIEWQNEESGSVGAMSTKSLDQPLAELEEILGQSDAAKAIFEELKKSYTNHDRYSMATIDYVHTLFGQYGLVVIDTSTRAFKESFKPIMREELLEQPSQELVEQTQKALTDAGFGAQAHARAINLFYLRDGLRERIVFENGQYNVLNTDYSFTTVDILKELDDHPDRFSPNVVMRPLLQEKVLPNLAYIGGGGELAYWMERQSQFEHFGINFPMLIRRNSLLWIDKSHAKRMAKLGLEAEQLFSKTAALLKDFVEKNTKNDLSIATEKEQLKTLFESIAAKAKKIDPTLEKAIMADYARQAKSVDKLESRLMRAEKQKHDTALNQIRSLKEKLYPANGLQERYDNFLPFYMRYGRHFFEVLIEELNPLKEGFVVILDEDNQ